MPSQDRHVALIVLGRTLESTLQPDGVLPLIVRTVSEALDVPYAAFSIRHVDTNEDEVVAENGNASDCVGDPLRLSVSYQSETVGHLVVAQCAGGGTLSNEEMLMLNHVAAQAGAAAHVVRMTHDLRRAREKLVIAREEERRRLRHDLHDSIGPTLAALDLRAGAIRNTINRDPAAAEKMMAELRQHIRSVITDIRRVVYNLRPPALDELGLLSAIREQAAQFGMEGLHIDVTAPEQWPALPTAYDVAIYRIVCEALNNVSRHAGATQCTIKLELGHNALQLEVADNGRGISENRRAGVGVNSMRDRVAELGGGLDVSAGTSGGTTLRAFIPVDLSTLAVEEGGMAQKTIW